MTASWCAFDWMKHLNVIVANYFVQDWIIELRLINKYLSAVINPQTDLIISSMVQNVSEAIYTCRFKSNEYCTNVCQFDGLRLEHLEFVQA